MPPPPPPTRSQAKTILVGTIIVFAVLMAWHVQLPQLWARMVIAGLAMAILAVGIISFRRAA